MEDRQERIEINHFIIWKSLKVKATYNLAIGKIEEDGLSIETMVTTEFPECDTAIKNILDAQFRESNIFKKTVEDFRVKLKRITGYGV